MVPAPYPVCAVRKRQEKDRACGVPAKCMPLDSRRDVSRDVVELFEGGLEVGGPGERERSPKRAGTVRYSSKLLQTHKVEGQLVATLGSPSLVGACEITL